jgi:hypothetical protein
MDYFPTAMPARLALGGIRIHVRFHHTVQPGLVGT